MPEDSAPSWRPGWLDRPDDGAPTAASRLAATLRAINTLLIEGTADDETLDALTTEAEALRDRLRAARQQRDVVPDPALRDLRRISPVTGRENMVAPPVRIWIEDGSVRGTATFDATYEGPPGHVHGGIIAAAFDEVLGATQSLCEQHGMTGTLTVRYRRPTPLHREVAFRGHLDRVSGRKILTSATLHMGGVLCAEAEAIFVAVDFGALPRNARRQTSDA